MRQIKECCFGTRENILCMEKQDIVRLVKKNCGRIRMLEYNKKSSIGDCNDCNEEVCKNICYQRYAKLFDDKYKNRVNETEQKLK